MSSGCHPVVKGSDSDPLFQSDTGAAESSTENTEVQKRSMNRVAKETPALTTGLKEGAASWESGDCRAFRGLCVRLCLSRAERTHDRIGEERNQT